MNVFTVRVLTGIPGSGKSTGLLDDLARRPRNVIWATARRELCDEQASYCFAASQRLASSLSIEAIHSGQRAKEKVGRRIKTALRSRDPGVPRVMMITHEALIALDPAELADWEVVIDEVPDGCVVSDSFSAPACWSTLDRHYALEPVGVGRWHQVLVREGIDPLQRGAIAVDAAKELAAFHKCVLTPGRTVYVDLSDWRDAQAPRRRVSWWSVWTPLSLAGTAGVTITGAGFYDSTAFHITQALHPEAITFERVEPVNLLRRKPQTFRIHYFIQDPGSTAWWDTEEGSRCVVEISRYLERVGFAGYFSCNAEIRPYFRHRFDSLMCNPKQAGTNNLIKHTACAYIYSNKSQESDAAILEVFELDTSQILQAREYEDIRQFVMRGASRDPNYEGVYDVYLYSRDQAEMLGRYLSGHRIAAGVELIPLDEAGIMDVRRPLLDRMSEKTVDSVGFHERCVQRRRADAARQKRNRDAKVAQQMADGTYRRVGRPPKTG